MYDALTMYYIKMMVLIEIVSIVIIFALRELWCWYWKINESIKIQKEIRDLLLDIKIQFEKSNKIEDKKTLSDFKKL